MASQTFRQLTPQNYQQIAEVLTAKYGLLPPPESVAVKDRQNNTVLMTDGLYLTVKYIAGHPFFQELIYKFLDEKNQYHQQVRNQRITALSDFL